MRQMPNLRYTARGRPHIWHRRLKRVEEVTGFDLENGDDRLLAHLGLSPVLDLGLRLGEGSGACLALAVLDAAALILRDMATFDSAAVKDAR